ncbi:cupin domain-containing protein [Pseudorhizobium pelagicum]|uniref:Cupin n=1 Tax=Pseudorhizobium pelagicum TaxID=1509405 RepID=A0A922P3G9_9HYPH|nr:cupin domain-containing protein [Pseudorhizobium pelagicum]KEQ05089.1 cupin [Pseudorhizobium pelagicum]KEQ07602.1 cupin [Pseudorhizobium pelagicum]
MKTDHFLLSENDWVPNNPRLPVIVHSGLSAEDESLADMFEATFAENGWQGIWRNGIFDYHHYHTTAHEVLGIARGQARVVLGGPGGRELQVQAGDCLVLPAGTGHCRISASDDFLVIGAYPAGQDPDLRRSEAGENGMRILKTLPVPETDPLGGATLRDLWGDGG